MSEAVADGQAEATDGGRSPGAIAGPTDEAAGLSAADEEVVVVDHREVPCWYGEAWAVEDGMVLNLPVFKGCSFAFKRLLLRAIREYEYIECGKETWYDVDHDEIITLERLPPDRLPPLKLDFIGSIIEPGQYICKGGDYDSRLVLVISGTVEKLVGDSAGGGLCVTRVLQENDCEGLTEFLGVGTEQRTCALRAGPEGARVRYVSRTSLTALLNMREPDPTKQRPPGKEYLGPIMKPSWENEAAYFGILSLDRIDSLNHKASRELLVWQPGPKGSPDTPLDLLSLPGQTIFMLDNALGTSVSGPLPEGIEDRYFFDGQTVLKPGVQGDCCIMILRGEVEALIPDGCQGVCLARQHLPNPDAVGSWLGEGRDGGTGWRQSDHGPAGFTRMNSEEDESASKASSRQSSRRSSKHETEQREVIFVSLVTPSNIKRAMAHVRKAAEEGRLDLSQMKTTDWRWSWADRKVLEVFNVLEKAKLLTLHGLERAEEVRLYLNPPSIPPPPEPQATLQPGTQVGRLALLGVPIVLAGEIRAKGPVLLAILHRHVLLKAIYNLPAMEFFSPRGLTLGDRVDNLRQAPPPTHDQAPNERPSHLGPVTGPPRHKMELTDEPAAGTAGAWKSKTGVFRHLPGADAFEHVLLNSIKKYSLIWDLVYDAPPRLLDDLVRAWEPRWVLPGEVVIQDETPDADFVFVIVHGACVVTLEGREIERIGQGAIQGAAQLLSLNGWTRTVTADPEHNGEVMLQVLRRKSLIEMLSGHPEPKARMMAVEASLQVGKEADWRLLKLIPTFRSLYFPYFLGRLYKDADIRLFCAGDHVSLTGDTSACMMVCLAGVLRCEQPQSLFYVELKGGEWCYQDNILANTPCFGHDVVAVTNVLVLVLYRHALQNAMFKYPETREVIMGNETWRREGEIPDITVVPCLKQLPKSVLEELAAECKPLYYRAGSVILNAGQRVEGDGLIFILRGEMQISILGLKTRKIKAGSCVGLHLFLGLDAPANQVKIKSLTACDCLLLPRAVIGKALIDELLEDDMLPYNAAIRVLEGGQILDAFGFPIGDGKAKNVPDCVEKSEVFRACSSHFVEQMPLLVEDVAFWPGERIYTQYDEGNFIYFIRAGRVKIEVLGRREAQIVDAGHSLGDMAVLDQVPHYCESVTAETHCWVRILHKTLLHRSLSSFPEEEKRIVGAVQNKGGGGKDEE